MNIIISNSSNKAIYEQIVTQIKNMIISGELKPDKALPSMRLLAKELRISVITTKRAYEELEKEGFIYTVAGKGSFIAEQNIQFIKEQELKNVQEHISNAVTLAKKSGITYAELCELLEIIFMED